MLNRVCQEKWTWRSDFLPMISNCNGTSRFRIFFPFFFWKSFTYPLFALKIYTFLLFYAIFRLMRGFPSNSLCFEMKFLQYKIGGKSKSGCVLERGDTELFKYGVRIRNQIKYTLSKSKRSLPFFLYGRRLILVCGARQKAFHFQFSLKIQAVIVTN